MKQVNREKGVCLARRPQQTTNIFRSQSCTSTFRQDFALFLEESRMNAGHVSFLDYGSSPASAYMTLPLPTRSVTAIELPHVKFPFAVKLSPCFKMCNLVTLDHVENMFILVKSPYSRLRRMASLYKTLASASFAITIHRPFSEESEPSDTLAIISILKSEAKKKRSTYRYPTLSVPCERE